jgi:hypothetical protein
MGFVTIPFVNKVVAEKELKIKRAKDIVLAIKSTNIPFVRIVECLALMQEQAECLILDIEVELGQKNVINQIEKNERIAIIFNQMDETFPEVLALREDFPEVPHINLREYEIPRNLCLYNEPFNELKLYLTPIRFVERIRQWLAETAKGNLHGDDQPLEPLFLQTNTNLIIPNDMLDKIKSNTEEFYVVNVVKEDFKRTYIVKKNNNIKEEKKYECISLTYKSEPHTHGVIRKTPKNLFELNEFTKTSGFNLIESLRIDLLKLYNGSIKDLREKYLLIIMVLPKKRNGDKEVETEDKWGFLLGGNIEKIGVEIGIWALYNNQIAHLFETNKEKMGQGILLEMSAILNSFSRKMGLAQNDISDKTPKKIVLVGVGALGSQIFMNLTRAGFGHWALVDNDIFLPHNLARHVLDIHAVGFAKAKCLSLMAKELLEEPMEPKYFVEDILKISKYSVDLQETLSESDVIVDCTASNAVTSCLANDISSLARKTSIFLNPTGGDSVLLIEDLKREIKIDQIEIQYYKILYNLKELEGHLDSKGKRIRLANSCSDINATLSQEYMSLHAAICSRALRNMLDQDDAKIIIWRANQTDMSVNCFKFNPNKMIEITKNKWTIYIDVMLLQKIFEVRKEKLPSETGGILIGSFDVQRQIIYIVDTILSPPDSQEWPTIYIRGCEGLNQKVKEISDKTLARLEYIGEWHSHPNSCSCKQSADDIKAFNWLADSRKGDGLPAIMLIAGEKAEYEIYVN